jgi:hypothetical protein
MSQHASTKQELVKQNAVHAIMMIAMVRAVDIVTKEFCAKALLNLVCDETIDEILEQGVLQTFGTFCIQDNETMMSICSKVFCVASKTLNGRKHILHRKSALKGMFSLIRSKSRDTQLTCASAVINLLLHEDSRVETTKCGALVVLRVLTTLQDYCQDVQDLAASGAKDDVVEKLHAELRDRKYACEQVSPAATSFTPFPSSLMLILPFLTPFPQSLTYCLCLLADDEKCRDIMIANNMQSVLVLIAQSAHRQTVIGATRAFCGLAIHKKMRKPLIDAGAVSILVWLVMSGQCLKEIAEDVARTLCYLSVTSDGRSAMVREHAVTAILVLVKRTPDESPVHALCALALQYFSWSKMSQKRVVSDGAAQLLVQMTKAKGKETSLAEREIARDCAVAFANLSAREDLRKPLMEQGVIEALCSIVDHEHIQYARERDRAHCFTTLAN